jgi:hypothetical protein
MYEYIVRLTATFDAYARTNSTPSITLLWMDLTATIPDPANPNGPWLLLAPRQSQPISASFATHGDTRTLPETRFYLAKTVEAAAEAVGVGVWGIPFAWPVPAKLKGM